MVLKFLINYFFKKKYLYERILRGGIIIFENNKQPYH